MGQGGRQSMLTCGHGIELVLELLERSHRAEWCQTCIF